MTSNVFTKWCLHSTKQNKNERDLVIYCSISLTQSVSRHISFFRYFIQTPRHPSQTVFPRTRYCYIRKQRIFTLDNWFITDQNIFHRNIWKHRIRRFPRWFPDSNLPPTNWRHAIGQCIQHGMEHCRTTAVWNRTIPFAIFKCIRFKSDWKEFI